MTKNDFTRKIKILTPLQKLPKNVGDLGKLIVATGFEKLPNMFTLFLLQDFEGLFPQLMFPGQSTHSRTLYNWRNWHQYLIHPHLRYISSLFNFLSLSTLFRLPQLVWPDLAIYWTLGNFLKPLATINFPKSPTFLGNFCKWVKIYHFWATFIDIWWFFSGHTAT